MTKYHSAFQLPRQAKLFACFIPPSLRSVGLLGVEPSLTDPKSVVPPSYASPIRLPASYSRWALHSPSLPWCPSPVSDKGVYKQYKAFQRVFPEDFLRHLGLGQKLKIRHSETQKRPVKTVSYFLPKYLFRQAHPGES